MASTTNKRLLILASGVLFFSVSSSHAEPLKKQSSIQNKQIRCHKFEGWHWSYHNSKVFVNRDKVILDNGITRLLLSSDKPKLVTIYKPEDRAYFQTPVALWYNEACDGRRPFQNAKLVLSGREKLLDLPCEVFDAIDKGGVKCGKLWTTGAIDIEPQLSDSLAEMLGLPGGYGLPIRADTMEHGKTTRYVPLDAQKRKGSTYTKASSNTLFEVTQTTLVQPYASMQSHALGQCAANKFLLPPGTAKAASAGALIYGGSGKLNVDSIDNYMSAPLKQTGLRK